VSRRPLLWLALACHLFFAFGYLLYTPSFEGPDENAHYQYAWHLANTGELPLAVGYAEPQGRPRLDEAALAHHPPLYYALLAGVMLATDTTDTVFCTEPNPAFAASPKSHLYWLHGGDELPPRSIDQFVLSLLRSGSVLLGLLSLLAVYRLAMVACPERPLVADTAALLVACLPMWSFQHAVLNNDNLATLLCTATLVVLARVAKRRELPLDRAVLLGVLLGLAMLTKATTTFLVVLAVLVFVRTIVAQRRAVLPAAVSLLVAAALFAPVMWRNVSIYGDPLAMNAHDAAFASIPSEYVASWMWGGFLPQVLSSLLGRFGWFSLEPHPALVTGGAVLAGLACMGLVAHRLGRRREALPQPFWLLVAACVLVFAGTAWFNLSAPQPQGRLLFPAIGPAAVLLAAGLVHLGALLRLPPLARWLCVVPPAVAAWVLFGWFAPAFRVEGALGDAHYATLVGGILSEDTDPGIVWQAPLPAGPLTAPPTLHWHDPDAGPNEPYSLYAYDENGRIWLASHEWHFRIAGNSVTLPADAWAFLPTDRDVWLQLRCVPDWRAGERREWEPISAPLRVRRAAAH
jgi:4-amino-4-deoxy-L-arabinose transferase-like glycosyltransferase